MSSLPIPSSLFFFFHVTATTQIYTLSLHDALPISDPLPRRGVGLRPARCQPGRHRRHPVGAVLPGQLRDGGRSRRRSEEHTSELQSRRDLVCRLLLEKKKKKKKPSKKKQYKSTQPR